MGYRQNAHYVHTASFDTFKAKIGWLFTLKSRYKFPWELLLQSILKQNGKEISQRILKTNSEVKEMPILDLKESK